MPPCGWHLCLGSGGARGYAHIGVINELRDRGYEIVGIAGSSMGALVGGLQAAGKLDDYAEWASSLTQRAVLRLLDPSITAAGVLRAEKILDAVREILGDVAIEDLPIPYTAVTTDLIAGKSVWLQRGPVDDAIRASIAIPGVISPHVLDGRLLADGGILDPLPMAPIAAVNADLTIAVSLNGDDPTARAEREPRPTTELLSRMWRSTTALLDTNAARSLLDTPAARSVLSRFQRSRRRGRRRRSDADASRCRAQARQLRGDEPHHRHRAGRADAPHAGGLSAGPADRGAAHHVPQPGVPSRRRGHRHRAGTRGGRARHTGRRPTATDSDA